MVPKTLGKEIKSNMLHNGLGMLAEDVDKESQNNFPVKDNEAKNGQVLSDQKIILHCLFVNPVTDFAIADKYFFYFEGDYWDFYGTSRS